MTLSEKNERLVKENAVLTETTEKLQTNDQMRRQEFSKAFNWYQKQVMYDSDRKLILPSWEQIFIELGKLLACRDFRDSLNQ